MIWEERWHPLRQEWVIIAAHRQNRPWQGEVMDQDVEEIPAYVSDCYLCPSNKRVSGLMNPNYKEVFVFDNDHPCVGLDAPQPLASPAQIYRNRPAQGMARVVCYSPNHNLNLAQLTESNIVSLLRTWQAQYQELGALPQVESVFIFENRGEVVGVSNPHPHCQIYATNFHYKYVDIEIEASQAHYQQTGRFLFQDILAAEMDDGRRIISETDTAIAFIPYFARYAYEVYVSPKNTHLNITTLTEIELADFAATLKQVLVKFDNLWQMSFPYVMTLRQSPTDGRDYSGYHFHIQIYPPLRKPNLLKYLGGPEIGGGNFLSDTSPEEKAAELIALPNIHYKAGVGVKG